MFYFIRKEKILVPNMDTVHVKDGYDNPCDTCEEWGEACESCDVSVPLVADEYEEKTVTIKQLALCGIPFGDPIYEFDID